MQRGFHIASELLGNAAIAAATDYMDKNMFGESYFVW